MYFVKKHYETEIILHISIKQYRNFEQSNITYKISISIIFYNPSDKLQQMKVHQAMSRLVALDMYNLFT